MKDSLVRLERGVFYRHSSGTYWIQYRVPVAPGSKRTKPKQEQLRFCTSVGEARKVLAMRIRDLFLREHRADRKDTTLREYLPVFLVSRSGKRIVAKYEQQLTDRFGSWFDRALSTITRREIIAWYHARRDEVATSTANNELAALRALLSEAVADGEIDFNPCVRIGVIKAQNSRKRILDREECTRLCTAAAQRRDFIRPLWFLLYTTGARLSEVLSLRWSQVNLRARRITIVDAKSGETRDVPLLANVARYLRLWRSQTLGVFVFPSRSKSGHLVQCRKTWLALCSAAGVVNLIRHDLRHNLLSWLNNKGHPAKTGMGITGHKTVTSLHHYTHETEQAMLAALRVLPMRMRSAYKRAQPRQKRHTTPSKHR